MNGNSEAGGPMPDVQVFLSRHAYPLGSAVVGTILIRPSRQDSIDLRQTLRSIVVYVAGYCRIDSRWHNVADYTKIYGTVHPYLQLLYQDFDADLLAPAAPDETVCFWATNGLELMDLPERKSGAVWDGKKNILAFTFRVDIPLELPYSINATSCRYYYSADVLIKTRTQQRIIKSPFQVWTNPHEPLRNLRSQNAQAGNKNIVISGARVKFGTINARAHSNGWPCHLSSTEINRPKGQMTVALSRKGEDVQSMRVSNAQGQPVCVMTVVGATKLTPGSRIHLQWDFPERISAIKAWIPCHQVAACLMGEELAIYEDGKNTRTQSYVFDTCHEWVDPGVTRRVSKTLLLSMDAPCNVYTDVMELSIRCQVDITVKENGSYNNLRLELPCQVVHSMGEDAMLLEQQDEQHSMSLTELLGLPQDSDDALATNDIASDLKILSLQMEERLRKGDAASLRRATA